MCITIFVYCELCIVVDGHIKFGVAGDDNAYLQILHGAVCVVYKNGDKIEGMMNIRTGEF